MEQKITLSLSVNKSNTIYTHSPINGKAFVRSDHTQSGVRRISVTQAILEGCSGFTPSTGDAGVVYSEGGSGKCVLTQKNTIKEGGGSATPYVTESLTFIGV